MRVEERGIAPLIIVAVIIVVAVVAGAGIYVATRGGGAGENQPVEKGEGFHLGIGESKNIVIGETEICITLVTCDSLEGTGEIRYSLDDNVTTRTFELPHIGDTAIVVDLPEGKITLLGFGDIPVGAEFTVSGNFEIKPQVSSS
jgi:hypothetical protein